MSRRALGLFTVGQICLFAGLAVCIAIKPAGLGTDNGVSYYGTFIETFGPFAFALLGAGWFSWLASRDIHSLEFKPLRYGLLVSSAFLVILTFTPYTAGTFMDWAHTISGTMLFTWQLLINLWLVAKLKYRFWPVVLAAIELIAGIVAAVYVLPKQGFEIQAQIIFQLAFGSLMANGLKSLIRQTTTKRSLAPSP